MKQICKRLLAGVALMAPFGLTAQTTFDYTGSMQVYVVPAGVSSILIEAYGAQGGTAEGGEGGFASGELTVTPGESLYIFVGGQGNTINVGSGASDGGWNGGGAGGSGISGASGGGASDVRQGGTDLEDRVIVAGGGGGMDFDGSSNTPGGDGGGLIGEDGAGSGTSATGGTQTVGGSGGTSSGYTGNPGTLGIGGATVLYSGSTYEYGGGGGGGYYGGASGHPWGSGAGGSSYIGGVTSATTTIGGKTGNGQIIITELCTGLTTSVSDDTICEGEMVTLSASSTGSGVVSWDGGVVDGEAFTPPVGTNTYTATSTDEDDCDFVIEIVVHENPTVDAGDDVTACEGEEITLEGEGTANDWSWDGGVEDGVAFVPTAGTYTLTGTVMETGCSATDEVEVSITIVDVTMSVVGGGSLIANQAEATYQWLECPDYTAISGETNQTFTPSADADYAVEVTYEGCVDTSICQVVHVGFNENALSSAKVYPNPTNGAFQVEFDGKFTYELTDVLGKTILSGQAVNQESFDLSTYSKGAYFLKVISDGKEQTMKVIKR
ncbi:MAG: T9SS type A sorting domain-containing protein [Flavobacteriales bacterium]|nr:T9SS type A sorting domain-containing protein [Flavobacteriales bacterium]